MTDVPVLVLTVDKVGITFSGRTILDDVSFEVHKGEFTGLIGSNGVGKTTLLRIILGLQRPDSGEVRVLGEPLSQHRRSLGYVPQKVSLDPDIPVRARDLVALGLDGHRFGFGRRSDRPAPAGGARCSAASMPNSSPTAGSGASREASSSGC